MAETREMVETKEWTLMFYFASDNPLAPNVVSQLKAIKNAGFHQQVNVITKFDPQIAGTPTHIFDVNLANKLGNPDKTFHSFAGNDPYVRSLVMDKLWGANDHDEAIRAKIAQYFLQKSERTKCTPPIPPYNPPIPPNEVADDSPEPGPKRSLHSFLQFCAKKYKARHYMLFILGHGLVVGNHTFLFDADAEQATLSLGDFAGVLKAFKKSINGTGELELLGLHSCSMSSLELAYELQGTANYMLASQGPNFVGSWPYREILIRVFNDQKPKDNGERPTPKETILRIFRYILCNSFDFQLAGYSFDLALCDLREAGETRVWLAELSRELTAGLKAEDPLLKELILLAHWDAQSYWQETYTDLFDFCFCLNNRCKHHVASASEPTRRHLLRIQQACSAMIKILTPERAAGAKLIVRAEFAGPGFQYSHGLSVYFPWSQPSDKRFWPKEYFYYQFKETGWADFLAEYFRLTQRESVWEEIEKAEGTSAVPKPLAEQELLEAMLLPVSWGVEKTVAGSALDGSEKPGGSSALSSSEKAGGGSALSIGEKAGGGSALAIGEKAGGGSALAIGEKAGGGSALAIGEKAGGGSALDNGGKAGGGSALDNGGKAGGGSALDGKPVGSAGTGGDCDCPSIKNYPNYTRHWPTSRGFFDIMHADD